MNWLTNERLFYGGVICIVFALVWGVVALCVLKMKKLRLELQMDREYGTYKKDAKKQMLRFGKK